MLQRFQSAAQGVAQFVRTDVAQPFGEIWRRRR
jgi:hypothetical protein